MTRNRVLMILAAALLSCAGTASANAIDPQIIIRGGPPGGTVHITGPGTINLQFTSNLSTVIAQGCTTYADASTTQSGLNEMGCPVVNDTPNALAGLVFHITPAFQLPLTLDCGGFCAAPPTFSADGATITFMFIPGLVFGTNSPNAGPNGHGQDFFITFAGFSQGSGVSVTPVPEPGTLALLATGIGTLALRRRRKNANSA